MTGRSGWYRWRTSGSQTFRSSLRCSSGSLRGSNPRQTFLRRWSWRWWQCACWWWFTCLIRWWLLLVWFVKSFEPLAEGHFNSMIRINHDTELYRVGQSDAYGDGNIALDVDGDVDFSKLIANPDLEPFRWTPSRIGSFSSAQLFSSWLLRFVNT